jgi:hypothetical protein
MILIDTTYVLVKKINFYRIFISKWFVVLSLFFKHTVSRNRKKIRSRVLWLKSHPNSPQQLRTPADGLLPCTSFRTHLPWGFVFFPVAGFLSRKQCLLNLLGGGSLDNHTQGEAHMSHVYLLVAWLFGAWILMVVILSCFWLQEIYTQIFIFTQLCIYYGLAMYMFQFLYGPSSCYFIKLWK